MRRRHLTLLIRALAAALVASACSSSPAPGAGAADEPADPRNAAGDAPRDLVIAGATVIDGTGAAPRVADVWIDHGVIVDIAEEPREATASVVVDAAGKYVIPGLWDVHVHFGSGGRLDYPEESERARRQFLWYGVTSVLSVGGTGGSTAEIAAGRRRPAQDYATREPHVYATGSMLTLPGSHPIGTVKTVPEGADPATYDWEQQGVTVVESVDDARAAVRRHAEPGMDGIKIMVESGPDPYGDDHPQMTPAMIAAIVEEAGAHGLPVFAHISSLDELEDVVEAGVDGVMHALMTPKMPPELPVLFEQMAEKEIFYVPTLSLAVPHLTTRWSEPGALEDPFLVAGVEPRVRDSLEGGPAPILPEDMPAEVRRAILDNVLASLKAAHGAGVKIALGTDTNMPFILPGYSAHVELEMLARTGIPASDVLVAATRRPAEMLGISDEVGTLEVGKRADLLVLDENPLEDIRGSRAIHRVVKAGRVIERDAIFD